MKLIIFSACLRRLIRAEGCNEGQWNNPGQLCACLGMLHPLGGWWSDLNQSQPYSKAQINKHWKRNTWRRRGKLWEKIKKWAPQSNDNLMGASWIANSDNSFKAVNTFGFLCSPSAIKSSGPCWHPASVLRSVPLGCVCQGAQQVSKTKSINGWIIAHLVIIYWEHDTSIICQKLRGVII